MQACDKPLFRQSNRGRALSRLKLQDIFLAILRSKRLHDNRLHAVRQVQRSVHTI